METSDCPKETGEIVSALRGLLAGSEREQSETFNYKQALDEGRPSRRKLFRST